MKKFLLLATFIFLGIGYAISQCTISDLKVRLVQIKTTPQCEITMDLSYTQEINSGNKFAYLHLWTQSGYHTPAPNWVNKYSNPSSYPVAADLVNALATIVIDENGTVSPVIGTVYHPDAGNVLPQFTGLTVTKDPINGTLERMTIKNVKLVLPSCTGAQTIKFDAWASQAANGKNVHCVSQGDSLIVNEVKPSGLLGCALPRHFQVIIRNEGPALDDVSYKVYLDYGVVGTLGTSDTLIYSSPFFILPADVTSLFPEIGYLPWSNRSPSADRPLLVEVTVPNRPNTTIGIIENTCNTVPVKFVLFTAIPGKNKNILHWQTATEQHNRGFEIERQYLDGSFETIAFVPTKSTSGNSEQLLDYSYDDYDDLSGKGNIFYRIKQVDFDGKYSFSETKLVRSESKINDVLVYPNPSKGLAKIILPNGTGAVDIILSDFTGKEIFRQYNVTDLLQLDNLRSGIYLIRVFSKTTGETRVKKLIVH